MRLPKLIRRVMGRPALPAGGEAAGISGGRDITRGYIEQLGRLYPLRDPRLRSAGATFGGYEVYENMLADDRVQSTFMQRRAAVVSRELEVLPGDNRRKSKMARAFLGYSDDLHDEALDAVADHLSRAVAGR